MNKLVGITRHCLSLSKLRQLFIVNSAPWLTSAEDTWNAIIDLPDSSGVITQYH
ncbi:MAG: hypothetical protein P0107_04880 [Nitrosomonas sp.]|nr:hypothetical protein [Nitrosomonas sp.]